MIGRALAHYRITAAVGEQSMDGEAAEVRRTRIGADHGLALELGGLSR